MSLRTDQYLDNSDDTAASCVGICGRQIRIEISPPPAKRSEHCEIYSVAYMSRKRAGLLNEQLTAALKLFDDEDRERQSFLQPSKECAIELSGVTC